MNTLFSSPAEAISYLLSALYIFLLLLIMGCIYYVVQANYKDGALPEEDLSKVYPKFQSAFELLRFESKAAQLYYV